MKAFKHKIPKAASLTAVDESLTLQKQHTDQMTHFATVIPAKRAELNELEEQLLQSSGSGSSLSLSEKTKLRSRISSIRTSISNLESSRQRYMTENSRIVFAYYRDKKESTAGGRVSKNEAVARMFRMSSSSVLPDERQPNEKGMKRALADYARNMDANKIDMSFYTNTNRGICIECSGELVLVEDEGVAICNKCFIIHPDVVENEKPSYKEPPKEVCFYAYQKINHFKEIVAQFQGKQTTQIPSEVFERIKTQLAKERIKAEDLTYYNSKEILKNLGYPKMYEHIAYIKSRLGVAPPVFSLNLEETLFNLFVQTQAPYARHCPDNRINFLNYYYVLYKLCELVEEYKYLPMIPLLKDPEKLINHDDIWKKMCIDLNWKFVQTNLATLGVRRYLRKSD